MEIKESKCDFPKVSGELLARKRKEKKLSWKWKCVNLKETASQEAVTLPTVGEGRRSEGGAPCRLGSVPGRPPVWSLTHALLISRWASLTQASGSAPNREHTLLFHSLSFGLSLPLVYINPVYRTGSTSIQILLDKTPFISLGHIDPPLAKALSLPTLAQSQSALSLLITCRLLYFPTVTSTEMPPTPLTDCTFLLPLGLFAGMFPAKNGNLLYFLGEDKLWHQTISIAMFFNLPHLKLNLSEVQIAISLLLQYFPYNFLNSTF